jgi:hypothetical protein
MPTDDTSVDTDIFILKSINRILTTYRHEINKNYNFVIKYDNDIFSFLAYRLIQNALIAIRKNNSIFILGKIRTPEEKEYFKNANIISQRRAKKHKKDIIVTGFCPIFNVKSDVGLSKEFVNVCHPLMGAEIQYLETMAKWYIMPDDPFKKYNFEQYYNINKYHLSEEELGVPLVTNPTIYHCILTGTEEDFPVFDKILKIQKNNILTYTIKNDNIDFVQKTLGQYVNGWNYPNCINVITKEQAKEIKRNYKNFIYFKGGSHENNNS